jgi:hypothetical protein
MILRNEPNCRENDIAASRSAGATLGFFPQERGPYTFLRNEPNLRGFLGSRKGYLVGNGPEMRSRTDRRNGGRRRFLDELGMTGLGIGAQHENARQRVPTIADGMNDAAVWDTPPYLSDGNDLRSAPAATAETDPRLASAATTEK